MQRTALKRLRAKVEASYAADGTGTIADYYDLRFLTAAVNRARAVLADDSVTQRLYQRRAAQFGFKSVAVEFSSNLCSTNEAITTGVTATKDSVSKLLEAICGGYNTDEGSAVASGASATGVTASAGEGSNFLAGTLVGVEGTTDGRIGSVVPVDTQSTDALTFRIAAHASPAVGRKLYNSQLIYPKQLAAASSTWLQFLVEGEDTDDKWLALGCQAASLTLAFPLGGLATWGFTANGAQWLHDDDFATPIGATALAAGTLDGSNPIPCKGGSVVLTPTGGTTRTTPHVAELTLNPGITWGPAPSHNGTEGIAQMVMMRGEQPTLSMLIEKADESWTDVLEAGTTYQCLGQFGNVPGATLALYCAEMQLIAEPTEEDQNGIAYWRLTWGLLENSLTDDAGTDLERAPWLLGRF